MLHLLAHTSCLSVIILFDAPVAVVCSVTIWSLYCASSSSTATGSVHKSRGDNSVCMSVQLKSCCVVTTCGYMSVLLQNGRLVMDVCVLYVRFEDSELIVELG